MNAVKQATQPKIQSYFKLLKTSLKKIKKKKRKKKSKAYKIQTHTHTHTHTHKISLTNFIFQILVKTVQ